MVNGTNISKIASNLSFPIGFLSAISFTLVFDIITITTIVKTHQKLIEAEFRILLFNNILSFIYKLIGILKTIDLISPLKFLGIVNCYIVYSLNNDVFFGIFLTYLFYSLFHLSTVSRVCCLHRLFTFTHSNHGFLIFFGVAFGGYTIFIFIYTTLFRAAIFGANYQDCNGPNIDLYNTLAITSIIVSFPIQFIYLSAILLLIGLRAFASKDSVFAKKFRSKFIILFKFFMFSVLIFLISAPQYSIPIFSQFWGHPSRKVQIASDVIFLVFFSIQCICLVLIHNFLRRTFIITFISPIKSVLFRRNLNSNQQINLTYLNKHNRQKTSLSIT